MRRTLLAQLKRDQTFDSAAAGDIRWQGFVSDLATVKQASTDQIYEQRRTRIGLELHSKRVFPLIFREHGAVGGQ